MKFSSISSIIVTLILVLGCGDEGGSGNAQDTDSDTGTEGCQDGDTQCVGQVVEQCASGAWAEYDDCGVQDMDCVLIQGEAQCVASGDTDVDGDTDTDTIPTTELNCINEVDDDSDGVIDGMDADCPVNLMFTTSETYSGGAAEDFDSLTEADTICQAAATTAGLPDNTYVAFMSDSSENAIDRLGSARGWVRVDGKAFADEKADISSRSVMHPPNVDENGAFITPVGGDADTIMTGSEADGTYSANQNCSDWSGSGATRVGRPWSVGSTWILFGNQVGCSGSRIACFGTDNASAVAPTPVAGKVAFISEWSGAPSGGRDAADTTCQSEATTAGLSGTFLALVATTASSAANRFASVTSLDPPWIRVDGAVIVDDPTDLFSGVTLLTGINFTATGAVAFPAPSVWTGSLALDVVSQAGEDCAGWDPTAIDRGERGDSTYMNNWFWSRSDTPCTIQFPARFYCLEQ